MIALGTGRQTLDVDPEQTRERVGLGVTEGRELGCDVLHRTMPLAQLHTRQGRARSHGSGGSGETVYGQSRRQCLRAGGDVLARRRELHCVPRFELCAAFASERVHGVGTGMFGKKAQRRGGHVVVVTVHAGVTGLGQDVCAGWPATTAPGTATTGGIARFDGALFGEQIEVTANRCGSQAQTRGEDGRGDRAILRDRLPDPVPGPRPRTVGAGVGPVRTVG